MSNNEDVRKNILSKLKDIELEDTIKTESKVKPNEFNLHIFIDTLLDTNTDKIASTFIKKLEGNQIPIIVENQKDEYWVKGWTDNPDYSEEILMKYHEMQINNGNISSAKGEITDAIEIIYDKRARYFAYKFAEMVNYNLDLLQPLLNHDSGFISELEEVDTFTFGLAISINENIKTLTDEVKKLNENFKRT